MYNYCTTHLYTNESPNLESCFFWPAPACVSVLRSGFPGSCCVCNYLLSYCLVVPVRCLGFYLVLLSGSVAVVCVRCICSGSARCACFCCCGPVLSVSGYGPAALCIALYPSCISLVLYPFSHTLSLSASLFCAPPPPPPSLPCFIYCLVLVLVRLWPDPYPGLILSWLLFILSCHPGPCVSSCVVLCTALQT